ncbi:MAG: GNAT family N-acetyltransferase [Planctomycetota bacterium]
MTEDDRFRVERITAEDTRALRLAVLRPGQPPERVVYSGDDLATSVHVGVRDSSGALVSVASFYREVVSERAADLAGRAGVRIRGMATLPDHRGRGYGRSLIERGLGEMSTDAGDVAWCNARTTASGYYERVGFLVASEVFDLPDIGPHVVMARTIGG